ncbi:casein kinase II, regulatory subunit, partial [Endogone sp. FLAS-F59071]
VIQFQKAENWRNRGKSEISGIREILNLVHILIFSYYSYADHIFYPPVSPGRYNVEEELDDDMREQVEKSARHLYGLIHARFVITSRGLAKMVRLEKYKKADFGRCPRVLCHNQPLLPVGLSDIPYTKTVKLYCPRCEDIYNPKSSRHAAIDGAYYGTSFPHMLFQVHPTLLPQKTGERYTPRIFGFKIHEIARQHRWQDGQREEMEQRLREHGAAGGIGNSSASGNGTAGGNGSGASVEGGGQKSGFFWVV